MTEQQVASDEQMGLAERQVVDAALETLALKWAAAQAKKRTMNATIKALGIEELKDQVKAKLVDYGLPEQGEEPVRFRVGNTGLVLKVSPPGEPKEVEAFVTHPKLRLALQTPKEED